MRSVIAVGKLLVYAIISLLLTVIQGSILLLARGRPISLIYPRWYHWQCCKLFGLKVIVEGTPERGARIIYVGNHLSYLDIPAIGSIIKGSFIAKKEVRDWPVFGFLGSLGQTAYISRDPSDAAKETEILMNRLKEPLPLIIFPEGTSSDGTKILPFKSSLFQMFLNQDLRIQPFTVSILSVDGKNATTTELRDRYAWHGDMTLEPHLWAFAKSKGAVIKISFEQSMASSSFNDRKLLSGACHEAVVKGLDLSRLAA